MARTVADTALLLDVLSEPDPRDWNALPPPLTSYTDTLEQGIAGLRIAFSPALGHATVAPEVAAKVEAAVRALEDLGAHVELEDPPFADPRDTYETMWFAGAASALTTIGDPPAHTIDPGLAAIAEQGRGTPIVEYLAALQKRDRLAIAMSEFLSRYDLLVTPTLPIVAFEAGREVPDGWPDERWPSWTPFTYPFNLSQQPAGTVPCGFAGGLPVGLQIVGARHADALVLRAARAYEAAAPQPTVA
jgi:aspartyl-tRNA(Asn)/glutamyl-tRNA(Gln) amidotransferase subunit A